MGECAARLLEREGAPWQGGRDGKGQWQWRWQGKGKERASRKGSEGRGRMAVGKKKETLHTSLTREVTVFIAAYLPFPQKFIIRVLG